MITDDKPSVPAQDRIAEIRPRVAPNWIGGSPISRDAVAALLTEYDRLLAEQAQSQAQLQWIGECIEGLDVSEFAESFPLVRAVADMRAQLAQAEQERDEALENQRRTYDNSVKLAQYAQMDRARAEQAEAERTALQERLTRLVEKWRNYESNANRVVPTNAMRELLTELEALSPAEDAR